MTAENYSKLQNVMDFYADWIRSSADAILSYLDINGKKIVDFGCGRGDWLKVCLQHGAASILGLDTYSLDSKPLSIPTIYTDLTKQIKLDEKFDVAICMEVAEHLDVKYSNILVNSLVNAAPVILFSAAIPGQGGVHHVNEQPPIYWHKIFQEHGYKCYDFREEIWNDEKIEPWYRMGTLVYVSEKHPQKKLEKYYTDFPLHIVHPDIFEAYAPKGKDIILHYDKNNRKWYPEIL
jgi:hypothetical protein